MVLRQKGVVCVLGKGGDISFYHSFIIFLFYTVVVFLSPEEDKG